MTTKDQANAVANSFLAQQRAIDTAARNATARPVPHFYQCTELKQLEPWQRSQVLHDAQRNVIRNWLFALCLFGWVIACILVWYLLVRETTRMWSLMILVLVCLAPQQLLRVTLVRREVRRVARQLIQSP
jgi:hypothetical protein